jgi:hypothetical protein
MDEPTEDEAEPIGALQLAIELDAPAESATPDTAPDQPAAADPA